MRGIIYYTLMTHQSPVALFQRWESSIDDIRLVGATLLGAISIVVGIYLPWLQSNPAREVIRHVYLPGMSSGLEFDVTLALLLLIAVSVAMSILVGYSQFTAMIFVLTGLSSIALPSYLLLDIYAVYGGDFIPQIGSLLTILGGTVVLVTGIAVFINKL